MPYYDYTCPDCGAGREEGHARNVTLKLTCRCGASMYRRFPLPALRTDSTFQAGRRKVNDLLDPRTRKRYNAMASSAGVSTTGKTYSAQLAGYPGDPQAWIDSRADVTRICRNRGLQCNGSVNVSGADGDVADRQGVPDDKLVGDRIAEIELEKGKPFSREEKRGMAEDVRKSITPKWDD